MSTNKEKLINRLTQNVNGFELVDVKFSLGSERFISEEAFCGEVLNGLEQVSSGMITSVKPSHVDGEFLARSVEEFLS